MKTTLLVVAGGAVLLAAGLATLYLQPGDKPALGAAPGAPPEQDCRKYLRCAALTVMRSASQLCKAPIEQLAAYSPQWLEPAAESIFNDYMWLDAARGTITFTGNRARFQNAGGALMPVAYECDFDPATGQVLDARARVGAPSS